MADFSSYARLLAVTMILALNNFASTLESLPGVLKACEVPMLPRKVSRFDWLQGTLWERFVDPLRGPFIIEKQNAEPLVDIPSLKIEGIDAQIQDLIAAQMQMAREVGVDLKKRIPEARRFHFVSPEVYKAKAGYFGWSQTSQGMFFGSGDILISVQENEARSWTLLKTNHELLHVMGPKKVMLGRRYTQQILSIFTNTGFADLHTNHFFMFNDGFIEVTNRELIRRYWPKFKSLQSLDFLGIQSGYPPAMALVDAVLADLARRNAISFEEMHQRILRLYLLGDVDHLRNILNLTYGELGGLALERHGLDDLNSAAIAQQLGLQLDHNATWINSKSIEKSGDLNSVPANRPMIAAPVKR
jgi:hypothetical protein